VGTSVPTQFNRANEFARPVIAADRFHPPPYTAVNTSLYSKVISFMPGTLLAE
jgi:hypothetical protein